MWDWNVKAISSRNWQSRIAGRDWKILFSFQQRPLLFHNMILIKWGQNYEPRMKSVFRSWHIKRHQDNQAQTTMCGYKPDSLGRISFFARPAVNIPSEVTALILASFDLITTLQNIYWARFWGEQVLVHRCYPYFPRGQPFPSWNPKRRPPARWYAERPRKTCL